MSTIRDAMIDDLPALVRLLGQLYEPTPPQAPTERHIAAFAAVSGGIRGNDCSSSHKTAPSSARRR